MDQPAPNPRGPLPEDHPVWKSALAAPFVPDTPEEAAYIASHPLGAGGPPILGEEVTAHLAALGEFAKTIEGGDSMTCAELERLRAAGAVDGRSPSE